VENQRFSGKSEVFWETRGFLGNHEFFIRVGRRVFDIEEIEYKVRSLVSGMVLWKTRGFMGNHEFSIRVDRRVFDIEKLESVVRSLVSRWI
jgi:hypothetical protein